MFRALLCTLMLALALLPACRPIPTMTKGGLSLVYRMDFERGDPGATPESMKQAVVKRLGELSKDVFVDTAGKELVVRIPARAGPDAVPFIRTSLAVRGRIEFREVDSSGWVKTLAGRLPEDVKLEAEMVTAKTGDLLEPVRTRFQPEATQAGFELLPSVENGHSVELLPLRPASLSNAAIRSATMTKFMDNEPAVSLTFNSEAAKTFADLTGRLINKRLAIVLDGRVLSAPVVRSRIDGGSATITLGTAERPEDRREQAEGLVIALKLGPFPAPLILVKEEIVQPSERARR